MLARRMPRQQRSDHRWGAERRARPFDFVRVIGFDGRGALLMLARRMPAPASKRSPVGAERRARQARRGVQRGGCREALHVGRPSFRTPGARRPQRPPRPAVWGHEGSEHRIPRARRLDARRRIILFFDARREIPKPSRSRNVHTHEPERLAPATSTACRNGPRGCHAPSRSIRQPRRAGRGWLLQPSPYRTSRVQLAVHVHVIVGRITLDRCHRGGACLDTATVAKSWPSRQRLQDAPGPVVETDMDLGHGRVEEAVEMHKSPANDRAAVNRDDGIARPVGSAFRNLGSAR